MDISATRSFATGTSIENSSISAMLFDSSQKCAHRNAGRKSGREEKTEQTQQKTDSRNIKDWSIGTVMECSQLARDRLQRRMLMHEVITDHQQ